LLATDGVKLTAAMERLTRKRGAMGLLYRRDSLIAQQFRSSKTLSLNQEELQLSSNFIV
jgi:hypothetical protein